MAVSDSELPFPLRRTFLLGVLPGLLVLIGAVVFATAQAVRSATTEVLLQFASTKVEGMAKAVAAGAPAAWRNVVSPSLWLFGQCGRALGTPLAHHSMTISGAGFDPHQHGTASLMALWRSVTSYDRPALRVEVNPVKSKRMP